MPQLYHTQPDVTPAVAERIAQVHWGLVAEARALPGERDRNFHLRAGNAAFVLKIANPDEERALLELQNAAVARIAARAAAVGVPGVVPSITGDAIVEWRADEAPPLFVRLLRWIPGRPMATFRPHSDALLVSLGSALGSIGGALAGWEHPAAVRDFKWDLAQAAWIGEYVSRIDDPARRAMVERIAGRFDAAVGPRLRALPQRVIHGDANDHNVIVAVDDGGEARVAGIVDFGDTIRGAAVSDLAIALAYAMMAKPDPLAAAARVVAGFHARSPLGADEIALILPLVRTRLAVSVVNSLLQRDAAPSNAYLHVSEDGAWALLERLEAVHDRFAEYRFRDACGLVPCPVSVPVSAYLDAHRGRFAHVVGYPLDTENVHVYNLSVGSAEAGTVGEWSDSRIFTRMLSDGLRDIHAKAGIGRYDEARPFYLSDVFRTPGNDGPEWRTVHTAIDVFLPAGAGVYAPLAGTVVSARDNAGPFDYGPTVILEHAPEDGPRFWTLYGHLSRETLPRLAPGQSLGTGDIVGWLGDEGVNGGWPPHLHIQVIGDLLDRTGDFPGVALPGERDVWLSISPDPSPLLGLSATARAPRPPSVPELRARRAANIGPSLSVSYRRPLHIVRGAGTHLIDADGRRYLDGVNNVAHVGHAHPDVVRAGQRQMAVLNTNTRYLNELLTRYAERLVATLPEPLRVCYFVCSGSEANELALRLARAHTGGGERDVIVLDAAYHGNTSTLVDVSPYKFKGPGGRGAPPWVEVVPMPDVYRGPFRSGDPEAGLKYAQAVRDAVGRIRQRGKRPSAFLAESMLSCGGQIVLPDGFLSEAYRHVRAAGGVCVADEVQVGLGRVGTHWWAFETQHVVPDIVTMGKPLGNGHPLGAVVTTEEIARSFANGMEYFNTFGGNPVSCAIGLEVIEVIEREDLRGRAANVGAYLRASLVRLAERHNLIGDVRGLGLFIGVEFVADRGRRVPAAKQAAYVANRMRDCGVLVSTDGPDHNVIKIKPPLCFSERDADFLVSTMDRVLAEDAAQTNADEPHGA